MLLLITADAMPVEIVQFCWKYNLERLQNLPELAGCKAKLRMNGEKPYVTDNSNYIVDLYFEEPIKDAHAAAKAMSALTGACLLTRDRCASIIECANLLQLLWHDDMTSVANSFCEGMMW